MKLASKLRDNSISFELFHEPWWNMGYSALSTEPMYEKPSILKRLKLWKGINTQITEEENGNGNLKQPAHFA